jgi:hypothetical protein
MSDENWGKPSRRKTSRYVNHRFRKKYQEGKTMAYTFISRHCNCCWGRAVLASGWLSPWLTMSLTQHGGFRRPAISINSQQEKYDTQRSLSARLPFPSR